MSLPNPFEELGAKGSQGTLEGSKNFVHVDETYGIRSGIDPFAAYPDAQDEYNMPRRRHKGYSTPIA